MMPMPMKGGGMGPEMDDEAAEGELSSDAKVEAIRSALRDLVSIVGGLTVDDAKKRKAAPAPAAPIAEVDDEEE